MNKIEEVIEHNLEVAHKFNILEVALFETYLFVFGILFGLLIPSILQVSPWIYGILALVGTMYMFWTFFAKNKDLEKRIKKSGWNIHLTKNFGMLDFTIYKFTVFIFGIFILQVFPSIGSLHIAWYTAFAGFGMGYFIKAITKK